MAPFKLKFRMGSSRSTSQEVDADPQVNQALLGNNNNCYNNNLDIGASSTTLDSVDCHSFISNENIDKKSLLPNTNIEKLGYTNPIITHSTDSRLVDGKSLPLSSYQHILDESHLGNKDLATLIESGEFINCEEEIKNSNTSVASIINESSQQPPYITLSTSLIDETIILSTSDNLTSESLTPTTTAKKTIIIENQLLCSDDIDGNRKESIDSTEYLISTMTSTPPSSQENLLLNSNYDECTGSCEPLFRASSSSTSSSATMANQVGQQQIEEQQQHQLQQHYELDENLMGETSTSHLHDDVQDYVDIDANSYEHQTHTYCTGANDQDCPSYIAEMNEIEKNKRANSNNNVNDVSSNYLQTNYYGDEDDDDNWDSHQNQITQEQLQHFISNKSSKKIYKAVAKQWGITCKMSDQCRCMDCQSKYFDCEYDQNEHHKTDGGLGAGTPMFISEVMHGSACTIL